MKKLFLALFAVALSLSASAQKFVELPTTSGDSLVINENRITFLSVKNDTGCLVQYLGYSNQKLSVTTTLSVVAVKALGTSKQFVLYNDSLNALNKSFIVSGTNLTDSTSKVIYFYPDAKERFINLDFSIDSLKTLAN